MRTAGILMTIAGVVGLIFLVSILVGLLNWDYDFAFTLLMTILVVFVVAGGVLCLKRKYWRVCFTSALLLFVPSTYVISGFAIAWSDLGPNALDSHLSGPPYPLLFLPPLGIPPLIFVCLRKREWQERNSLRD